MYIHGISFLVEVSFMFWAICTRASCFYKQQMIVHFFLPNKICEGNYSQSIVIRISLDILKIHMWPGAPEAGGLVGSYPPSDFVDIEKKTEAEIDNLLVTSNPQIFGPSADFCQLSIVRLCKKKG